MALTAIEQKVYNKAYKLASYRREYNCCTSLYKGDIKQHAYSPIKADDISLEEYLKRKSLGLVK
jgi:hypothetical protein